MKDHLDDKIIVWLNYDGSIDHTKKAVEKATPLNISKYRLIWAILTEVGFLWKLTETIKYALMHYDTYRGSCASSVMLFEGTKNYEKIWIKEKKIKKNSTLFL